jgi:hypothetical protein
VWGVEEKMRDMERLYQRWLMNNVWLFKCASDPNDSSEQDEQNKLKTTTKINLLYQSSPVKRHMTQEESYDDDDKDEAF